MDDGYTVLQEAPRSQARSAGRRGRRRAGRGRTLAPRYWRRRLVALAIFVGLVFVAGRTVLAGPAHTSARAPVGPGSHYLARIATLAGSGKGSLAAMEISAQNQAIDATMQRTPFVRVAGSQHREIALTFDDGPGPYTPQILAVLRREHVPATFFQIGILQRYFHVSTTAIVAAGDVIGDHTEAHAPMSRLSAALQRQQLLQDAAVITQFGASFPRLFRPPYGLFNQTTLALLRRYHMLMVLWTVDTSDYRRPGVRAIVRTALSGARPGAIILMHDAGGNRSETVAALPQIIAGLRARGYQLVTVPRLLLDNPAPAHQNLGALAPGGG